MKNESLNLSKENSGRPTFAIIGAGAVGIYYGSRLVQHGYDVHFLLRSDYAAAKQQGFKIKSCLGNFDLSADQIHIYNQPLAMPKVDCVIVTLKTTANTQYEPLIAPLLHDQTAILTLQNGLGNEDQLARLFGEQRVLGGMAFTCINRIASGSVDHSAHGHIHIGEFNRGITSRVEELGKIFNASKIECRVLDDLKKGRWEKLIWNVPFNGTSAVLDQDTEVILSTPQGWDLIRGLMEEVLLAAKSDGVDLDPKLIQENLDRTTSMGPYKSSMQIDREMKRPMEIEAILGEPVRVAKRNGMSVPKMETLYQQAVMVEVGQSKK